MRNQSRTRRIKAAMMASVGPGSFVAVLTLLNSGGLTTATADDRGLFVPSALSAVDPGIPPPHVDTSRPFWYEPYAAADAAEPRPSVAIAGVTIGQYSGGKSDPCPQDELRTVVGPDLQSDIALAQQLIRPGYLPAGAVLDHEAAVLCAGELVWYTLGYTLPIDHAGLQLVAQGKASWFDVPHGGFVEITKLRTTNPGMSMGVPQGRLSVSRINSTDAVVAAPIMKAGFGEAFAASWDPSRSQLLTVSTMHLTVAELTKVAEGVMK